jgi:MinD superfamily P-loop ATPase
VKIVIASGKGGTGKTTLSVNLAVALAYQGSVGLLDCDVEEPNCHLYLKPYFDATEPVNVAIPVVDAQACTGCGLCARACEFHALLALPGVPLLLPELCHDCGACAYVCPEEAISDGGREIGRVGAGRADGVYFRWGRLHVGEARSLPVIRAVKDPAACPNLDTVIIDAPPGVACPTVETLRASDFAVLVTEPTPFGLHDLRLAVDTTRQMDIPFGVVINRAGIGDSRVNDYCSVEGVPILMEIPDDRRIAEACSRGEVFAATDAAFAAGLRTLATALQARIVQGVASSGTPVEKVVKT